MLLLNTITHHTADFMDVSTSLRQLFLRNFIGLKLNQSGGWLLAGHPTALILSWYCIATLREEGRKNAE